MPEKYIKMLICTVSLFAVFSIYIHSLIPDRFYCVGGEEISVRSLPMVTFVQKGADPSRAVSAGGTSLQYTAKLFGVMPLKTVNVSKTAVRKIAVAGTPFGVKMFSDGVLVVGFSDIETEYGYICPAKVSGLKMGDIITALDGKRVQSIDDVENFLLKNGTKPVSVAFLRDNLELQLNIIPVKEQGSGVVRTGMWVRDSSAGVGTMTFYDMQKGMFAGLGHGIKDTDTQKDIRLLSGEIVPVKIMGVTKSRNGEAGELKGTFTSSFPMGRILANSTNGVYGTVFTIPDDNIMEIAQPQEIQTGPAQIITTISGTTPKSYDVVIEKIALNGTNSNKNMIIRITDPELLKVTGGIVQGMSGSPVVQNGKLVGAITHVFVNQVERGYAVFATNMLESMDNAEKVHLNKAG